MRGIFPGKMWQLFGQKGAEDKSIPEPKHRQAPPEKEKTMNKHDLMEESDFPLSDCYVENQIKAGYTRRCVYPHNSVPTLTEEGKKRGVQSPLITAFGLDESGE